MGLVKRRVPTKSGATAVQVARYQRGQRQIIKHVGSAHDEATLALLEAQADELIDQMLGAEQQTLELEVLEDPAAARSRPGRVEAVGSRPRLLWETLCGVYEQIFGGAIDSDVFKKLVLARIIRTPDIGREHFSAWLFDLEFLRVERQVLSGFVR